MNPCASSSHTSEQQALSLTDYRFFPRFELGKLGLAALITVMIYLMSGAEQTQHSVSDTSRNAAPSAETVEYEPKTPTNSDLLFVGVLMCVLYLVPGKKS